MKKVILFILIFAYLIAFAAHKVLDKTVGYDYDSTLAFSTPTFLAEKTEEPSPRLDWELINGRLLQLEKKKWISMTVPAAKFIGLTPIVITSRPEVKGEIFRAHVARTYGIKSEDVYMTKEKAAVLKDRHAVIFFGDSNSDITEAQKAGVRAVRVKRSGDDFYKGNYDPGDYGEFVLPFSDRHF